MAMTKVRLLSAGVGAPSRTAAKRQARHESHIYRQGSGWILSTWDDQYGCARLSGELPWPVARQALADWRRRRVAKLMGEEVRS
jgi:hypothetical protein